MRKLYVIKYVHQTVRVGEACLLGRGPGILEMNPIRISSLLDVRCQQVRT